MIHGKLVSCFTGNFAVSFLKASIKKFILVYVKVNVYISSVKNREVKILEAD